MRVFCIVVASLMTVGCLMPSDNDSEFFRWTVDGEANEASSNGTAAGRLTGNSDLRAAVVGSDCGQADRRRGMSLFFLVDPHVGMYTVGDVFSARWTFGVQPDDGSGLSWEASPERGSGSVTVEKVSQNRISGHFSLQMAPAAESPATGVKSVKGQFDASFKNPERGVC